MEPGCTEEIDGITGRNNTVLTLESGVPDFQNGISSSEISGALAWLVLLVEAERPDEVSCLSVLSSEPRPPPSIRSVSATISVEYRLTPSLSCHSRVCKRPLM